jgi:hypothetical protein
VIPFSIPAGATTLPLGSTFSPIFVSAVKNSLPSNETKTLRNDMRKILESRYLCIQLNEMLVEFFDVLALC